MTDLPRVYNPSATLDEFHGDPSFVRGVMGPIGGGKSVACCMEIMNCARTQKAVEGVRSSRWAVIRNSYPELLSTTIKTWTEWVPESLAPIRRNAPITASVKADLGDGTRLDLEVVFLSMNRPQDTKKLLSLELTGAWCNEARELPKAVLDALTGRVGRYPSKASGGSAWSGIIMDTNPPDTDHWWYKAAEIEKPSGWRFWKQPSALIRQPNGTYHANPAAENVEHHTLGYQYWQRQIAGKDQDWINVYILGQYGSVFDGKPVYEGLYDPQRHTTERPVGIYGGLPIFLAWDFGLTPACLVGQLSPRGQLRILREYICEDGGLRQFVESAVMPGLNNDFAGLKIVSTGDPAGNQRSQVDEMTCIGELGRLGIPTEPAVTNDFARRRDAVISYLTRTIGEDSGLLIDPSCKMLRRGFAGGYQFARVMTSGTERYHDQPVKNKFSHCIAKGTIVATERGDIPIEDVQVGERVVTPTGYCKVSAAWLVRENAEVLQVDTDSGQSLRLTPEHYVKVGKNWCMASLLQEGDTLEGVPEWADQHNTKPKSSMVSGITSSQRDTTKPATAPSGRLATCTGTYGSTTTGRSQTDMSSTTKTGTRLTTTLRILNAFRHLSTPAAISMRGLRKTLTSLIKRLTRRRRPRGRGMGRLMGWCYTNLLVAPCGPSRSESRCAVPTADALMRAMNVPPSADFARRPARAWLERQAASMTKTGAALYAAMCSAPTSTLRRRRAPRIVGVSQCQEVTDVYDLSVEDAHCFYANGILVHNCHDALQYLCLGLDRATVESTTLGQARPERGAWAI